MTTRAIRPLPLPDNVIPNTPETAEPAILWVEPSALRVDPAYQRDLSRRSVALIQKIVSDFDWRRFKPPVVIESGEPGCFDIIDGQHTAIAAATHGGIARIPVIRVEVTAVTDKAKAFLGHNVDRVAMGSLQLFWAAVAAGDETALTVKQVCDRAGARILRLPPPRGVFERGDVIAVGILKRLVGKRSAQKARIVIETCVKGGATPVGADLIRAVDELLHGGDYAGEIDPANLVTSIIRMREFEARISEIATAKKLPVWRATTIVLYQNTRKNRVRS